MYYGASADRCPKCGNRYIDKTLYILILTALASLLLVLFLIFM